MVAANGDLLIADTYDHRVRLVSGGTIATVAGTGVPGFSGDGGLATAAELNYPHGLAVTPDGGFLIADSSNHRIRKVSSTGIITTVVGTGTACAHPTAAKNPCGDNGPAILAHLDLPRSITLTPSGGLIFSDVGNSRVREVSPGRRDHHRRRRWHGDGGPATLAELDMAQDVVIAAPGLLISDASEGDAFTGHNVIRIVTPSPPTPPQVTKISGRATRVGENGSSAQVSIDGVFSLSRQASTSARRPLRSADSSTRSAAPARSSPISRSSCRLARRETPGR